MVIDPDREPIAERFQEGDGDPLEGVAGGEGHVHHRHASFRRRRQVPGLFDEDDSHACTFSRGAGASRYAPRAMQNLRDKLLKAGLVTEKQAQEADKGQKGPKATVKARQDAVSADERQRQEAFAQREAELSDVRRKEAAKKAEARMQSERVLRLRQLVEANRVREPPGEVNFHFVKRSGKIGRLAVSAETAKLLESGAAAVVEDPGQPEHAVVPSEAAKRIYEVDPPAIRFWFGPEKPIGFELE